MPDKEGIIAELIRHMPAAADAEAAAFWPPPAPRHVEQYGDEP